MTLTYHRVFDGPLTGKYQKVAERLPTGCSVLEVGCHTGYFSRALMARGHHVLGIDMNAAAARIATEQGVVVIVADVEQPDLLRLIPETFDAIVVMDVLEHTRDPVDVLRRLKRKLNPHGRVLITGPNVANWEVRKNLLFGKWNYTTAGILDRTHLHFCTASSWRQLVVEAGYSVAALESADGLVPLVHWIGKVPPLKHIVPRLHHAGVKLLPGLFTISYLIEAVPSSNPNEPLKQTDA
jgi:2-polyprenyl-3-methyl-5-hydroxy-6-metoxy-1,4-benzoquinol methylase